ncbi:butyrophilin-like protein 2 isoform X2 [Chiloscyllium punctatum]|uniref:butyrophilin-like protein 2 isoform X2 n=1 Tax=Chiloscyllium punctatum TaxID=137246 RepID=UPI003B63A554
MVPSRISGILLSFGIPFPVLDKVRAGCSLCAPEMAGQEQQGHSSQKLLPPLLLLLLNVVAAVSGNSPVPVSGYLREQVVLPCTYKRNAPVSDLQIIWGTLKREIVHKFVNGSDDLREQDPRFRNRTNLFKDQLEQGNWSVLISDLRETDQDEYQCQIYSRMEDHFRWEGVVSVHLSVTERAPTPALNTPVLGDSPVPVSGFLGEQVLLPCIYKGNVPVSDLQVMWGTSRSEIVHKFVNGSDDLRKQDPRFRNRTNLFKDQLEQGNWSVLISDLRETDQDEYQCQIYRKVAARFDWEQTEHVHLSVTGPGLSTGTSAGLGIGIAAVFIVAGIVGYIVLKRRRNCDQSHSRHQSISWSLCER